MAASAAPNGPARLVDVLKTADVKPSAVFTGYGADGNLADASRDAISRGVLIKKALTSTTSSFAMNSPAVAEHPRAGAAGDSGLARLGIVEMVHPHLAARQGARRPRHERHLLQVRSIPWFPATSQREELPGPRVDAGALIITNPMNGTTFGRTCAR
jgi:hypothetical protein